MYAVKIKKIKQRAGDRLLVRGTVYSVPFVASAFLAQNGRPIIEVYRGCRQPFVPLDTQATRMAWLGVAEFLDWDLRENNSWIPYPQLEEKVKCLRTTQ